MTLNFTTSFRIDPGPMRLSSFIGAISNPIMRPDSIIMDWQGKNWSHQYLANCPF